MLAQARRGVAEPGFWVVAGSMLCWALLLGLPAGQALAVCVADVGLVGTLMARVLAAWRSGMLADATGHWAAMAGAMVPVLALPQLAHVAARAPARWRGTMVGIAALTALLPWLAAGLAWTIVVALAGAQSAWAAPLGFLLAALWQATPWRAGVLDQLIFCKESFPPNHLHL